MRTSQFVLTFVFALFLNISFAQWNETSIGNISYNEGRVGIGFTTPRFSLDVNGTVSAGKPGDGQVLLNFNSERNWQFRQVFSGPGTALELASIGGSGNKNFRINTEGGVGIGSVWAPAGYKLFADGPTSVGKPGNGQVLLNFNSERNWQFRQVLSGPGTALELASIGGGGGKNFRINTGGTVSIGSVWAPSGYKLAVDGRVICEELKVKLNQNWPDYVFQADYQLATLQEVEQSIHETGHLPGIPSAAAIEAQGGVDLGEMQRLMMEKIEELTLYMIDLKKENEALKASVAQLQEEK